MYHRLLLTFFCWSFLNVHAGAADSPFRVVLVDKQTEEQYGPFPLSRSLLAKGIEQIKTRKAKGIILKFFLDIPKDARRRREAGGEFFRDSGSPGSPDG